MLRTNKGCLGLKQEKDCRDAWVRHFSEILNRNDPTNTVVEDEIVELEEIEEIYQGR